VPSLTLPKTSSNYIPSTLTEIAEETIEEPSFVGSITIYRNIGLYDDTGSLEITAHDEQFTLTELDLVFFSDSLNVTFTYKIGSTMYRLETPIVIPIGRTIEIAGLGDYFEFHSLIAVGEKSGKEIIVHDLDLE